MNLLYITFKDFTKHHFGANKKVFSQCKSFKQFGYDVTLIGRQERNTVCIFNDGEIKNITPHHTHITNTKLLSIIDKWNEMKDIIQFIKGKYFEVCYIRYDLSSPLFIKLLSILRKLCRIVMIEIPTYPYKEEYSSNKLNLPKLWIDSVYSMKMKKYVDRIVTFYDTNDEEIFGIKKLIIPNGFDFESISILKNNILPDEINIAAVSSMREWHGYERFIEGLHYYYSSGVEKRNIILHLVGNGREYEKYNTLVQTHHLSDHVILHGAMYGEQLDNLLESCTLTIDSLARHRTGITVLSSLKSREYGAKGIPFINSCKIDIIDDDFPYMLQVPANEDPIDINDVIAFHDNVYANVSRLDVAQNMRKYIESRSDMNVIVKRIIEIVYPCKII